MAAPLPDDRRRCRRSGRERRGCGGVAGECGLKGPAVGAEAGGGRRCSPAGREGAAETRLRCPAARGWSAGGGVGGMLLAHGGGLVGGVGGQGGVGQEAGGPADDGFVDSGAPGGVVGLWLASGEPVQPVGSAGCEQVEQLHVEVGGVAQGGGECDGLPGLGLGQRLALSAPPGAGQAARSQRVEAAMTGVRSSVTAVGPLGSVLACVRQISPASCVAGLRCPAWDPTA